MKHAGCLLLAAFIGLVSCTTAPIRAKGSFIRLTPAPSVVPIPAEQVAVFFKQTPDFPFVEIGIVEAIVHGTNAGLADLFPELQRQAAIMGADGVYKIDLQRYNQAGDALHATGIAVKKQ